MEAVAELIDVVLDDVTDGWSSVYKIDVRTGRKGQILWKMDPGVDKSLPWGIPANRGVALYKNSALSVTIDGRLVSTNLDTGEIEWEKQVATEEQEYLTVAPLIVKDMVIIGVSGADNGIRGWIQASNASTGEPVWRRYLIPAPGEPGSETWKDDWNAWETGGGSGWVTGSYDADLDLLIWGIGNPAPDFDNAYRPGDNLYTNSMLAMNPDTGEIQWYFQFTPNDPWDFDEVGVNILIDQEVDGVMRKLVGHSARNGFYYTLDRTNGQFINAAQYSQQVNWTKGIDPKTGRPLEYDSGLDVQVYAPGTVPTHDNPLIQVCPTIGGGNNYFPSAYSPDTKLFYIVGTENCSEIDQIAYGVGEGDTKYTLGADAGFGKITRVHDTRGSLSAVDPATGTVVQQISLPYANYSGLLSTAGGLIITGHLDGTMVAYDNETLQELWSMNLGTPFNAPPMTYSVNGKQYIAILAGIGSIAKGNLSGTEVENINTSSTLYVFSL